jgi:hypothetical protein
MALLRLRVLAQGAIGKLTGGARSSQRMIWWEAQDKRKGPTQKGHAHEQGNFRSVEFRVSRFVFPLGRFGSDRPLPGCRRGQGDAEADDGADG